jgi:hypothetical protein
MFKDAAYRIELQDQGFGQVCLILPDGIGGDTNWLASWFLSSLHHPLANYNLLSSH